MVEVVHARVQGKIVPSQNEPLLSCNIQSSRYRKAFSVSHSQLPEINEDPEQLHSRYEMRGMFVAVVEENLKLLPRKNDIVQSWHLVSTLHSEAVAKFQTPLRLRHV